MRDSDGSALSACPRNCYSTCGLTLRLEGGRLRAVEAAAANRATAEGPCLKGLAYVERIHSPDRLLRPLRRNRRGGHDPVSWDEALDEIAHQLRSIRAEDPRRILHYEASGTKGLLNGCGLAFWRLFGGCTTTYGDLCWPAGLEATRLTLGAATHNAPWDLPNARLILMWGKNPAETNIHQMEFLAQARERGARLVVIDPRRTESAERAELLIRPRPGTDAALALAVAGRMIDTGRVDEAFIRDHVLGYEEFARLACEWTPERASTVCGVPADRIERLAELLGEIRPATIVAGYGMQRYANGGQTIRALIALTAISGNLGLPGGGWQFANLQTQIFGAKSPLDTMPPPASERGADPVRVSVSTARLGRDMAAQSDPPLKMAWVERGNPVGQNPDTNAVLAAFRALEFRVVVDQFLTDTAREADIVLPAKSFVEQSDVIGAYWHPYLQHRPRLLDPPGEVRPETEVYRALAARLDLEGPALDAAVPGPGEAEVEAWLEERLAAAGGPDLEALKRGPVLSPEFEEVAFADRRFPTPSGKVELRSEEAARLWGVSALPEPAPAGESAADAPEAGSYPLLLMTPNTKDRIHSQFGNLALIRALDVAPRLHLHPDDAAARGIVGGELLRAFNARGEFRMPARIDRTLLPGTVLSFNGAWRGESAAGGVNDCSPGLETDMGHGAAFHENRVQVEKVVE